MITVIDQNDVNRSSTLEKSDIGKWAVVENGCFYIRESKESAEKLQAILKEG